MQSCSRWPCRQMQVQCFKPGLEQALGTDVLLLCVLRSAPMRLTPRAVVEAAKSNISANMRGATPISEIVARSVEGNAV